MARTARAPSRSAPAPRGVNTTRLAALRKRILARERAQFGDAPAAGEAAAATRGLRALVPRDQIPTWNDPGDVVTAVSPDCSFELLKGVIDSARRTLLVYIYNITSDSIVGAIVDRKKAGVDVRVMYDVTDSKGGEPGDVQRMRDVGVDVRHAPSSAARRHFTVCHQKYVVADGKTVYLGSANFADSAIPVPSAPGKFKKGNREWMVRVDGEQVAGFFADLFQRDWDLPKTRGLMAAVPMVPAEFIPIPRAATPPPKPFAIGRFAAADAGRVTPVISPVNYRREVEALIRSARKTIDIQQQYIKVGGPDVEALIAAVRDVSSSVKVRILISPAFQESWEDTVDTLKLFKLDKFLRAMNLDHYKHLHNKGLIVDGRVVVVSSTNWSNNSVAKAREAGLLIRSAKVTKYYAKAFDRDWANSLPPADATRVLERRLRSVPFGTPGEVDLLEMSEVL